MNFARAISQAAFHGTTVYPVFTPPIEHRVVAVAGGDVVYPPKQ